MLGFSNSEEIIDHNIIEFIKQDKIGIVSGVFQNALSNIIQSDAFEIEAHRINGQTIYLSITFVSIKKDNKVIGLRGTIRDITEGALQRRKLFLKRTNLLNCSITLQLQLRH